VQPTAAVTITAAAPPVSTAAADVAAPSGMTETVHLAAVKPAGAMPLTALLADGRATLLQMAGGFVLGVIVLSAGISLFLNRQQ
jgi:hypothetical protein